ncbi:MAG TPA: radical SAM protein [Verrucomicrobiae bacterium]|nr:radical SAM protein [Verrucomicrobiae bacterium]
MKHIAFIAMSGVRAHNEELTRLGLTLPGFVERNKTIASLPSLGLLTLAGVTPDRFRVSYHEIADMKKLPEMPVDFDLVAISTFTAQFYEACAVADYYRAHDIPVVMGGITASALREQAAEHCTSVVVGEGELLWPELLADFERGHLKSVYSTLREFDLQDAPMPRFDLLDPSKYNRLTVQTSRGCPHRCEFCASSILLTRRYKVKPVDKVIEEIREIKRIWPKPFIEFADDNSFVDVTHYQELLRRLAQENVRWFTEADVRMAQDDELLGLMRDSGCKQVLIGLESWRAASLRGIELKSEWKWRQRDFYKTAIAKIQSYGITVNGCFIFGLDGDTPEVFDEALEFVRESGLYEVQITFLTAFPGTPLYARLKSEGRILRDRAWELCTLFDINIQPKNMSIEELQTGFLKLAKQLYSAEETQERRTRFKRRLKFPPNFGQRDALNDTQRRKFAACCG